VRPNYAPTIQEVIKILSRISHYSRRFFLCLWARGARYSEITGRTSATLDLEEKTIRLIRNGGEVQTVGLNNVALAAIQDELARRGNPVASEPLFTNRLGKRIGKIHHALAVTKAEVPRP
jgi:site-specific recombinase XerC